MNDCLCIMCNIVLEFLVIWGWWSGVVGEKLGAVVGVVVA